MFGSVWNPPCPSIRYKPIKATELWLPFVGFIILSLSFPASRENSARGSNFFFETLRKCNGNNLYETTKL